ncbi:MAG: zinc-finger domain-containing protein [Nisaea sp.]|jgi:uncharacterized Zn-finger protein|uniref:zinc-finger domain-containing protein n=1 Tax=Nisaea sp. TaxID=2024842 RepID=UPI001B10C6A3|nr:zinc-finger domain-containing protein [Nisaea sp.]MBO6561534.1 zinc-finger domain-containing protein [Nisaea sp.]
MAKPFEVITVTEKRVACDGGKGALGHPRVFLTIDHHDGKVTCPYCSREFVYSKPVAGESAA